MNTKKATKRALLTSVMALVMCVVMLVGTTFAWFTDTASTGVNKIQAGNLDIELAYKDSTMEAFKSADESTPVFKEGALWEPGHVEYVVLKISNAGNLALKYKLGINIAGEEPSINVYGDKFNLSDYIKFAVLDGDKTESDFDRDALVTAAEEVGELIKEGYTDEEHLVPAEKADDTDVSSKTVTLVVWMPTDVGNEANHKTGEDVPSIDLGISVIATQYTYESDSFGSDYDKNADGTPQFDTWYDNASVTETVSAEGETVIQDKDVDPTIKATIPAGSVNADKLTLIKNEAATPGNITIDTGTQALTANVKLVDQDGNKVTAASGKFFTLSMEIGKNLNVIGFYHNEIPLTKAADDSGLTANDMYYYNASTGYVTYTTDDFSPFTVVLSNSDFNGGDGTEAHPYLIATGEQAYQMRNAGGYFKLVNDIVVTNEIYLSGKTVVVDLNGHSIKLAYAEDVTPNNGGVFNISGKKGDLTINDSSEGQTGTVIGSDKTYKNKVTSAVRVGNYGKLTINGGHFYGTSEGTSCIFVMTSRTSGSKATVTINGGKFETTSALNGTYYVLNHQDSATTDCTITVNGGSFKNYNPGVTVVDPVNAYTGKIALGAGCTTTSEVVDDATWYTVSK